MSETDTISVVWRDEVFHLTPHAPNAFILPFARETRSVLWCVGNEFIVDALIPGDTRPIDLRADDPQDAVSMLQALLDERCPRGGQ